ncbi:hypothetical protein BGX28_001387 [Mortierella sp. GBA30]|nr:hypothetical protein BGX28_001387 [Mortierella sp. GBA30]
MDIISALGIADRPYQSSYDFFSSTGSTPSPPRSLGLQQQSSTQAQQVQSQQYYHHSATLTKRDSMALLLSSSSSRTVGQEDYETRTSICAVASECQGHHHDSYRRTLSYELKDEDDDEYADMEDGGILKIEADSVLDEDLENLSPIPFSDLPSLTNIGLCSHGIVKLSSNIRLLASATCVQIRIPVEIGFLRNLTLLDLSKNRLTSLPETIKHLSKLVDLKLSFNQLESIPAGIGGLTKLAALYLDNNRLESIPSHIGQIKGLVNLDLSDNPITVLPAEVGKLQFLRRLKLDRCPLKEEFVHSPLHSPPTLLELAARVIVRHEVPIPSLLLPHLKTYLRSARKCTFCDGPYFDSWVKRGKMIEKNDVFIPLEYTLCQPHWNTEMERVKLLFCQRPITSPPPKNNAASASSSSSSPSSSQQQQQQLRGNQSMAKRQQQNTTLPSSTFSSSSPNSGSSSTGNAASGTQKVVATTSSDSAYASASTSASPSPSEATQPLPTVRPRRARNTVEGGERQRPMSLFTNRLSMLLKPKAERREERPTSTIVMGTSTPSTAGGGGSGTTDITLTRPGPSSSSQAEILPGSPSSSTTISAVVENSRPTTTRAATSTFLKRAGLKMRRPLSMGSALEGPTSEIVGTIPRIPTTTRPTTRTLTPESLRRV